MVLENVTLHDAQPRVQVLKPLLERHPEYDEGRIPHVYRNTWTYPTAGDYFDMITGTSTGGIIALGLSIGKTAKAILDLYIEHGDKVFPPARYNFLNLRNLWRSIQGAQHHRYDPAQLEGPLKHIFKSAKIGDAQRRLCIPSFDGFTEVNVFKTPHHPDYKMDWKEDMVTVAMATAAAPTYFPVYKNGERMFADGGIWANNPVMIGLVDCPGLLSAAAPADPHSISGNG